MKHFKKIIIGYIISIVCLSACTEMDHTYKEFWENGELEYPASVDSVKVFPGKNRIGFEWQILADPSVTHVKMYWNNKSDSLMLPVETGSLKTIINDLKEGTYSFTIYTYDGKGNQSIPYEITSKVYGETYQNSLYVRLVKDAYYDEDENLMIVVWGDPVDETSFGSEMLYMTENGMHKVLVSPDVDTLKFTDYDVASGSFNYRTAYLPAPMALDTFYTPFQSVTIKGPIRELNRTGWTVTASSWDTRYPNTNANPRTPEMVLDGVVSTRWVNEISPTQTDYPHWIALDMKSTANVYGVILYGGNINESPSMVTLWTSEDGENWTSMGTYSMKKQSGYQYFEFNDPQQAQYVKIECTAASGGTKNVSLYEVGVYTR
ncbi:MAG: discoidin domain-containing protein [Bacteroidales bacterium]|jgi:hypothetical protein|nr:discoidin domain-containing protein [Bacteroidales bacterium]